MTAVAYARMDSIVGTVWVAGTGAGVCAVGLGAGQPAAFFAAVEKEVIG